MNRIASLRGFLRVPLLRPALLLTPRLAAAASLSTPVPGAAAQQAYEYPDPFPGGYPSLAGAGGAGRMYMESYFPPPVTASPTYPAWSPDGEELAFAYQGRIWIVPVEGGTG